MKKLNMAMCLVFVLSLLTGSISATRVATGRTVNKITSGVISIDLHDETTGGVNFPEEGIKNVVPGQVIDKKVYVENTCEQKEWVRIKLTNSVLSPEGKSLDFNKILLDINTKNWIERDGWYYYKDIVLPGHFTEPLITTVTFDTTMNNDYANSSVSIVVNAQAVQTVNNEGSIESALGWPDTVIHDGVLLTSASSIKIAAPVNIIASSVKYNNNKVNDGFEYTPSNTDMFQNFKNVMPGDVVAQDIIVKNDLTNKSIKVYMRAEPVKEEDRAFLENMVLMVHCNDLCISNANASQLGGLKENVLLGTISPETTVTLTASLFVDIRMDNEFALQEGDIVWVFTIEEVEQGPDDIKVPDTGDSGMYTVIISSVLALLSGGYIVYDLYKRNKKRKDSKIV